MYICISYLDQGRLLLHTSFPPSVIVCLRQLRQGGSRPILILEARFLKKKMYLSTAFLNLHVMCQVSLQMAKGNISLQVTKYTLSL